MKIKLFLTGLAAITSSIALAGEPAACCAVEAKAAPVTTCCAEMPAVAPLSARSLYQLEAQWTNDAGETVELASLRGQPVIVAMFFAQCEYACPMLVNDIARACSSLAADVREKARVVLVSFDTKRDTPVALQAFRERMKLDARWTLLRGESDAVQELAMLLGVKFKEDARGQFAHSNLITALNADGEIAYQRAGLQGDVSELTQAVTLAAK